MRTFVYVDGFNLYYRAVRKTPNKWLDLDALCRSLLDSKHSVECIKYFTANVQPTPYDPDMHMRQQAYLRALRTIRHLRVIRGHFTAHVVSLLNAGAAPRGPAQPAHYPRPKQFCSVIKQEEKGSDVNMAVHMVADGFRGLYDAAVVVSNDSDLEEAFKIVKTELHKTVGLLCPADRPVASLKKYATFTRLIRRADLERAQFPAVLQDAKGKITKPVGW